MSQFEEIISSDQLTLVDFYADWCGPCQMMKPVLVDLKNKMKDSAKIITINVDKNPNLSASYQVRSVPTLMLFKNGEMLWRHSGTAQAFQLESILKEYL